MIKKTINISKNNICNNFNRLNCNLYKHINKFNLSFFKKENKKKSNTLLDITNEKRKINLLTSNYKDFALILKDLIENNKNQINMQNDKQNANSILDNLENELNNLKNKKDENSKDYQLAYVKVLNNFDVNYFNTNNNKPLILNTPLELFLNENKYKFKNFRKFFIKKKAVEKSLPFTGRPSILYMLFFIIIFYLYFGRLDDVFNKLILILIQEELAYFDNRLDDETLYPRLYENVYVHKNKSKNPFYNNNNNINDADKTRFKSIGSKENNNKLKDSLKNIEDANNALNFVKKETAVSEFQIASNVEDRLSEVKGIDEIKEEIEEIVHMLKDSDLYENAGAKLVRGILLMGKPGTGKTLLARALAGESGVNFIFCNGADFDKSYVGEGNSVIKKLFKTARENQPCIVFIDEIDSLLHKGRRSGKYSTSNDRSLINTFLSEMDGFKQRDLIFVLGATNSEKDLDKAAIRPGRFDKLITVPLPDSKGREEIFDLYLSKIKLDISKSVSSKFLSKITPGFSGAEIQNLVNHAVIDAVDKNKRIIENDIFEEARDRVLTGIKRKLNKHTLHKLIQTAVHEAGHGLVCYLDDICKENIHKVSITPRGDTQSKSYLLSNDSIQGTKEELISYIDKALGGSFAEEIFFSNVDKMSFGCGKGDLDAANSLAKSMIKKYGMSGGDFGFQTVEDNSYVIDHRISDITRDILDESVLKIINNRSSIVKSKLKENSESLKALVKGLIEYEELTLKDMEAIIDNKGKITKPKKNSEVVEKWIEHNSSKKI